MKRFIYAVVILLGVGVLCACIHKPVKVEKPITVIVMDTTQALLPDAQVKIGKKVFTTSFDGRVVIKPEEVKSITSIAVSCVGYEGLTVNGERLAVSGEELIVKLKGKKSKKSEDGVRVTGFGLRKTSEPTMMIMAEMATADGGRITGGGIRGGDNGSVAAGRLTAGEVNDFAKWNLWSSYLQSSQRYEQVWGLAPQHRYTVQVTDKHGYPIVNYPLNLTDEKGNTIFQAVTDNTGKAELWEGLTVNGERLAVSGLKVNGERLADNGITSIIVDDSCEHGDEVDVVFVFDATGSMGDELRYLRAEMKDVIARASAATGNMHIRTGAVVYRDHSDEYLTRISRLTDDIATTQAFIDKQQAGGGGDYEEAVPEALMAALNSAGWDENARARIAFLILDAPCHDDSATLALLHEQILNAAALGVRIVPVVCSGLDESGEYLMRSIALATNGTSFFLTDDSGIGNPHLKPKTDSLKVEHLNDMLVRTIVEFSAMPDCSGHWTDELTEFEGDFVPNPFEAKDLTEEERVAKDSRTTLYLLDITGKLITIYQGRLEDAGDSQLSRLHLPLLSTGVYFVKAYYDGEWHTQKILVH